MASEFGHNLRVSIFGQSHGTAIGVVMDGLPAGEAVDFAQLQQFLKRRAPGRNDLSTPRKESDRPTFLSGLEQGKTCGTPLCAVIENQDPHSRDYAALADTPRPGHADYTAFVKWAGQADLRGGGHFSGRLTAPLCVAGGIAKQILARRGVYVGAHLAQIGSAFDEPFPLLPTRELLEQIENKSFPVLDEQAGQAMQESIRLAGQSGDSVGGAIECCAIGLAAGLGGPMFDGVENRLAAALFGIPAVKGVEFGTGFACAGMYGSAHNDPFRMQDGRVVTETNHAGGILGGITTGMPLVVRVAIKPTPSIAQPQKTVSLSEQTDTILSISGRHDPCIAPRAVPVVEAVTALVLLDLILEELSHGSF